MSKNGKVKKEMIARYGPICFIERLGLRDTPGVTYTGCRQREKMLRSLTYHHIIKRSKGGETTVENGAILSVANHRWFHKQTKEAQDSMNDDFQALKRRLDRQASKNNTQECSVVWTSKLPKDTVSVKVATFDTEGIKMSHRQRRAKRKEETRRLIEQYYEKIATENDARTER